MSGIIEVKHVAERQRYTLLDDGKAIGSAHYRDLDTGTGIDRVFFHTVVDEAYAGQGLAGKLAAFALEDTVALGHKIVAVCPYIKAYTTKRTDEYAQHLVAPTNQHVEILPQT